MNDNVSFKNIKFLFLEFSFKILEFYLELKFQTKFQFLEFLIRSSYFGIEIPKNNTEKFQILEFISVGVPFEGL